MNYKSHVIRDGPNRYVLPREGKMRCPVTAFLSPELFESTEEGLWDDAVRSASMPGAMGMYLMPDCHKGYVLPVGGVLVTEDVLVQAGSGYDISCGIVYLRAPGLHASDVADRHRRESWVRAVELRVATGNHANQPPLMERTDGDQLHEILRFGAKALQVDERLCERQYIPIGSSFDPRSLVRLGRGNLLERARAQMGSVGGGNHFIELQVDRDDGSVWVMVHTGSRAYGYGIAEAFFEKGARLRGLPRRRREESWLRRDEPLGREFWDFHNSAANYAVANRHRIVQAVVRATEEVFGHRLETFYEISHNLIQEETLRLPDGTEQRGFVHRKGATRAFPAGHPDLEGTVWEATGHPCLIPGSMYEGAAILYPDDGAWQSGCSVNHGAGRRLARRRAIRELGPRQAAIDTEMRTVVRSFDGVEIRGIVGNTSRTPLDECAHVYKDLDSVLQVLESNRIARVAHRLFPIANLKGT